MTKSRQSADYAAGGLYAGKNKIINGDFKIWQRGTTLDLSNASSASSYWADRWCAYRSANPTHIQFAYNSSGGPTGIPTFARIQRKNGNTSTEIIDIGQTPEITNIQSFVGKSIVLSFYARAGSNFSAASNQITVVSKYGTGTTDSNGIWNTWTGQVGNIINQATTLTTSWQRFSYTVLLNSAATQLDMRFQYTPTGTAGTNDYFDVTGVQLEVGEVATPFVPAGGGLYGTELALCQRYFYDPLFNDSGANKSLAMGFSLSSAVGRFTLAFPVSMRTAPTLTITPGSFLMGYSAAANSTAPTGIVIVVATCNNVQLYADGSSAMTANIGYHLYRPGTTATVQFNSEL